MLSKNFFKIICIYLLVFGNFTLYAQKKSNFYIYLCFGQSNMEGLGNIESQDSLIDKRFKVFQSLDCADRKKAHWYTAVPPNCQCDSKLSLADNFGKHMVSNLPDSITVGIINVSVGGADIRLFDKDLYTKHDSTYKQEWFLSKIRNYGGNPYKHLIDLAKMAQNEGIIKGILLHQGETNAGKKEWVNYVAKIYNNFLHDLTLEAQNVPLLAGEMVSSEGNCCAELMNPIINKLPEYVPTAHIISSAGCTSQDKAHFDAAGYREIGKRYAVKMLQLMGQKSSN